MTIWIKAPKSCPDVLRSVGNPNPEPITPDDVVYTRMDIWASQDHLSELFPVSTCGPDRHCQLLGRLNWDSHFVDPEVRIWADYCSSTEVNSLSRQITPESALLSL